MTAYVIPIKNAKDGPFYFTVDLGGTFYQLEFDWNDRDKSWYMTVSDTAGNVLRAGLRVAVHIDLLLRWVGAERPSGALGITDYRDEPRDPTLEDLGNDALLMWLTE